MGYALLALGYWLMTAATAGNGTKARMGVYAGITGMVTGLLGAFVLVHLHFLQPALLAAASEMVERRIERHVSNVHGETRAHLHLVREDLRQVAADMKARMERIEDAVLKRSD